MLTNLLFPGRCPVCDGLLELEDNINMRKVRLSTKAHPYRLGPGIHTKCMEQLIIIDGATCMKCGQPLDNPRGEYCYDCGRKHHNFVQGKGIFLYKGAIKDSMYHFKYANKQEYATFFAMHAKNSFGKWIADENIQLIVPVPMYRQKEKQRGYNQAAVFAKELSRATGIPYNRKLVSRIKNTAPQKMLNDVERKNNLKNAFKVDENIVKYSQILLVDDIYTTGSTIDAIAGELMKAGIQNIYFLSICIGKGI